MLGLHPHQRLLLAQREARAADIEDLIAMGLEDGALEASRRRDGSIREDEAGRIHLDPPSQEALAVLLGIPISALLPMRRAQATCAWNEASTDALFARYPTSWTEAVARRRALNSFVREGRPEDPETMPGWIRTSVHLAKIADMKHRIRELEIKLAPQGAR